MPRPEIYRPAFPKPGPARRKPRRRAADPVGARECQGPARGLPGACSGGLQRHHVTRRSQGGDDQPDNLVWLCLEHHTGGHGVHALVDLAKRLGLLA
jgi:hypothetical protein